MNRALVKRLINDYLDGEIGLADKAELERLMAEDPAVLAEYKALRQIGLQLSGMPDVAPHPTRLRARVQQALEAESKVNLLPQRVFAGAMAVALGVICLSFGLLVFQQRMIGSPVTAPSVPMAATLTPDTGDAVVVLDTWVDADRYFSRLMLENQLGMVDPTVLASVMTQTSALEGATCRNDSLDMLKLAYPVHVVQLKVTPLVAQQMSKVGEEVAGRSCPLNVTNNAGHSASLEQYLRKNPTKALNLMVRFK